MDIKDRSTTVAWGISLEAQIVKIPRAPTSEWCVCTPLMVYVYSNPNPDPNPKPWLLEEVCLGDGFMNVYSENDFEEGWSVRKQ